MLSLKEKIDTSTAMGNFFFRMTASIAELERDIIRERTLAGLATAKARGRKGGRKKSITQGQKLKAKRLAEVGKLSITDICKKVGISRASKGRIKQIASLPALMELNSELGLDAFLLFSLLRLLIVLLFGYVSCSLARQEYATSKRHSIYQSGQHRPCSENAPSYYRFAIVEHDADSSSKRQVVKETTIHSWELRTA